MNAVSTAKAATAALATRFTLTGLLLILGVAAIPPADALAQVYENQGCTSVYDNDGGWFGWAQYNVTSCWKVIMPTRPEGTLHYVQTFLETDGALDDELGKKIHCVPPASWTQRFDGRWEVTLCKTWQKVSTYYGDDWDSTLEFVPERPAPEPLGREFCEGPSCGAVMTTFWQVDGGQPLMQVLTLEDQECPIVRFQYGQYQSDFSQNPIPPGMIARIEYPAQIGLLPYAVVFQNGRVEQGLLSGLRDDATSGVELNDGTFTWGKIKSLYHP